MKKTITKNDGTTETVEGTPEEIAEYERKLRGGVVETPKPKGPGILTDELQRLWDLNRDLGTGHAEFCQITIASRGWWSVIPPVCTCGKVSYPVPGGRITYLTPGDRTYYYQLNDSDTGFDIYTMGTTTCTRS